MSNFLKAYILGTAGVFYFRSGMCSLPICWHLHSEFGLVWSRDHGTTNKRKIILCSSCLYTLMLGARAPFSWAARHTTVCLD